MITLKPGDELTADLLEQLRDEATERGDENTRMLVNYIQWRRDDHVARLLYMRLLGKYALQFARNMRSLSFVTDEGTMANKMYTGVIDNFINDWKGWIEAEPPSLEPSNIAKEFSEDGTQMHAKYVHWTANVVGKMLAESLLRPHNDPPNDRHIYFNNVTLTMKHEEQKFAVTLQRCDGETPAQQRLRAEQERDEYKASLKQVAAERDRYKIALEKLADPPWDHTTEPRNERSKERLEHAKELRAKGFITDKLLADFMCYQAWSIDIAHEALDRRTP